MNVHFGRFVQAEPPYVVHDGLAPRLVHFLGQVLAGVRRCFPLVRACLPLVTTSCQQQKLMSLQETIAGQS